MGPLLDSFSPILLTTALIDKNKITAVARPGVGEQNTRVPELATANM